MWKNKRIYLPFITAIICIAGFLGYQSVSAITSTYTQPLYDSHDVVATADAVTNAYSRDVIGNKTDAAAADAVSETESLVAYAKQNVTANIAIDTVVDSILVDTGTTIPATITTAQNDLDIITGASGVNLLTATQTTIDAIAAAAGASYGHANYLAVATGTFDTTGTWSTVASHEIATVTGMVRMLIIAECVTSVSSTSDTGTMALGDETTGDSIIAASTIGAGAMAAGELWVDATLTRTILTRTQLNAVEFAVAAGKDIGYTVGTNALTAGSMVFHIYWTPLDSTGAVVAGEGGTL